MSETPQRPEMHEHFRKRRHECKVEGEAYAIWLGLLTPVRWFTVIGGILLSAAAGVAVLLEQYRVVAGEGWRIYGGICAIVASILTGIHASLNCDAHQTECRRLVQLYAGLESAFDAAPLVSTDRLVARFDELEAKFEQAKSEAAASPPQWCRKRARQMS